MKVPVQFKFAAAILLTTVAVYFGVLNLGERAHWQEKTDGVIWRQTSAGVEARLVSPDGPAADAGISQGDLLLSLDGRVVADLDDYTRILESLDQSREAIYVVRKSASQIEVSHPLHLNLRAVMSSADYFKVAVAFIYLVIGVIVFFRNWNAHGAFHFYLVCFLSFLLYLFRYTGEADRFDVAVYWISSVALLLLPSLFLHFCLCFPSKKPVLRDRPGTAWLLYLPFAVLLGVHILWFSGALYHVGVPRDLTFQFFFDRLHLFYFVLTFLLATAALFHGKREATPELRQQMKWITRGSAVGVLPFALLYALPYLFGQSVTYWMEASILSLACIPVAFGYAILRYRLMDVDILFKTGAAYFAASGAVVGIYFVLILLAGRAVQVVAPQSGFVISALAALAVAFLFAPLRGHAQSLLDRRFYKDHYDYRNSFADFAKTLTSDISLPKLSSRLLNRIRTTLDIDTAALLIRDELAPFHYRLVNSVGMPDVEHDSFSIPEIVFADYDRELNPLFMAAENPEIVDLRSRLHRLGIHYLQPLRLQNRTVALLAVGKKRRGDFLTSEDLDLVSALSSYAAIAIENAGLYGSLQSKAFEFEQLKVYSENLIESTPIGIVAVGLDGRISTWNSAFEKMYGLPRAQAVGARIEDFFSDDALATLRRFFAQDRWLIQETVRVYKLFLDTPAGRRIVNVTLTPLVLRDDVVHGVVLMFDDISEKTRLEDQLQQAEKLTSIGLLAAGVAHEVNTPLTGISSYAQILLKNTAADDPRREALEKIEQQTFRASTIVNNLLNFARVSSTQFEEVDVNSIVTETLSLLDHQLKKSGVEVEIEFDPALPATHGNGGKLQQVFLNLFMNARDAMPRGGHLRVRTRRDHSGITVDVEDSGVGISPEHIKKIYDPFFTTKDVGNGTGLGLSISYGIIQEHAGRISVESAPGKGTCFTLKLPASRVH